jgi:hypothetical protein
MTATERLIKAFYTHSEELGREVEALAKNPRDSEKRERVLKLVNRDFGKHAALVYETITAVVDRPG